MAGIVVDTHTIVWYLLDDSRLSAKAAEVLDAATASGEVIHVPSICLVELTYLVEKRRLPAAVRDQVILALDDPTSPCSLVPLDRLIADALESVRRSVDQLRRANPRLAGSDGLVGTSSRDSESELQCRPRRPHRMSLAPGFRILPRNESGSLPTARKS